MRTIRYGSRGPDVTKLQETLGLRADGIFGPETEAALKQKQAGLGLEADGVAGPRTWAGLGLAPPLPTEDQVHEYYGPLRAGVDYREGPNGRILPTQAWVSEHIAYFRLHDGRKRLFNVKAGDRLVAAFKDACDESGWNPESVQTTVFRHICWDPKRGLSDHSWGIALDINPGRNGMGLAVGKAELDGRPRFVAAMERHGFEWGGHWKGKKRDPMHFQFRVLV